MGQQLELFKIPTNKWEEHYHNMPEYNNVKQPEPLITATFKFTSKEDFDEFHNIIKEHLFNGERVFDGMQRVEHKQSWYPHKIKPKIYRYE